MEDWDARPPGLEADRLSTLIPQERPLEWVVGFLVNPRADTVVLVRKNRPEWQAGLLNGVGGKVEEADRDPGFTYDAIQNAMSREFGEEAGVYVPPAAWDPMVSLTAVAVENRAGEPTPSTGVVHFLRSIGSATDLDACTTKTDEEIGVWTIGDLLDIGGWVDGPPMIPNLRWLLPLAVHVADDYAPFQVVETATRLRRPPR